MRSKNILKSFHIFFIIAIDERSMMILSQDLETAPGWAAMTFFDEV
jgi:hypothetical protein